MRTATDIEGRLLFPVSQLFDATAVPDEIVDGDGSAGDLIKSIFFTDSSLQAVENGYLGRVVLVVEGELTIAPFGDAAKLVIGGGGGLSVFEAHVRLEALPGGFRFEVGLVDVPASLRVSADILRPLQPGTDEPVPGAMALDILLGGVSLTFGTERPVAVAWTVNPSVPRCMIGDSGIVISAGSIRWLTPQSENLPSDTPTDFTGLFLDDVAVELTALDLDADPTLQLDYAFIGRGGFTGRIDLKNLNLGGAIGGFEFELREFGLTLVQNAITASNIHGSIMLPFFDEPLDVEIGLSLDGGFTIGVSSPNGLLTLKKPGILELTVESIRFAVDDGVFTVGISGSITPLALGANAPSFAVRELSIDSKGNVRLEGGWLTLPKQLALDFFGFRLEITKIGFGKTDPGKKWVGFSGGLKLIDALPAGASVEGLRLTWDEELLRTNPAKAFTFSLNGVGVEFEVEGVVKFKGSISFAEPVDTEVFDDAGTSLGIERVQRFDGAITLALTAINFRIDAVLVVGSATGVRGNYSFFAIYLSAELPAGIPLGATGLGLFGAAGLFALAMEPNRKRDEKWYGVGPRDGWYKRGGFVGVADLKRKWDPNPAALAFGAGVTIGTVSDNGYTFAGSVLLVIVIPGPIIMLEGKANLLKERATLTEDPLFRMLAVIDGRAGTLTVGLDVHYRNDKDGALLDIGGGVEAYFDFHNPDAWHIYLGEREPRERRIGADIFKLFRAEGYFMIDSRRLQTGAWVGVENHWNFGPLKVTLEAWLEANVLLGFKPLQLHGDIWLHGNIGASVFGFGLSLIVDAKCEADVFKPFHLLFDLHVKVDLPWPLPDFAADATFEYGPIPDPPLLPLPLKEIAVEHFKVTTKWPLPRKVATPLLLPDYDSDDDGFRNPSLPGTVLAPPAANFMPGNIPVVPLDARPLLTFGRSVHDVGMVGGNPAPALLNAAPPGWEWLGDPGQNQGAARAQYRLVRVALEKRVGTAAWSVVACRPKTTGVEELYGSWAPVPHTPSGDVPPGVEPPIGNVKLWLWSKSPFDFTRQTGRAWDEWFTDHFPSYPCVPPPPDRTLCCNFDAMPVGTALTSPFTCPDHPEITLTWTAGAVGRVTILLTPIGGHKRALCFPGSVTSTGRGGAGTTTPVVVTVTLPDGGKGVDILVRDPHGTPGAGDPGGPTPTAILTCVGFAERKPGFGPNPRVERQVSFDAATSTGARARETRLVSSPAGTALDCAFGLDILLPCDAERVVLTLVHYGTPARVTAITRDGSPMRPVTMRAPNGTPERLVVTGRGIVRVVVEAPSDETHLLELCWACPPTVTITGTDGRGGGVGAAGDGATTNGTPAGGRVLTVSGPSLSTADVTGTAGVCIAEVCVTLAPDPADVLRHEEMTEHMVAELARWSQTGEVLEPDTIYRLEVVTEIEVKDWAWESPPFPFGGLATPYDGIRTQTEYAYFRTEGPPGLTKLAIPLGTANDANFDSGLEDLTRYVEQTVPATVPGPGEKPPLPRPVYRAYDVGVRFNEDYVDLMYRAFQRDLGLYLYDNNDQPVRDVSGRLIVLENRWGAAGSRTLSEAEKHWIATVNASRCAKLDETTFPSDRTLTAGDGTVLDADTIYEARLLPLLLHDDFSAGREGWETPIDQGTAAGPSAWMTKYHATLAGTAATVSQSIVTLNGSPDLSAIDTAFDVITLATDTARASRRYRITAVDNATKKVTVQGTPALTGGTSSWEIPSLGAVVQTSAIAGGATAGNDPVKPGTMLVRGDPATWTDYRFSVVLRNSAASGSGALGAVGVLFRAKDATNYYRFSMDQSRHYRRLVRVINGTHTILAEDDGAYASNSDYHVTVEAVGESLRVYLDGALLFDAHDATHLSGRVGLYTWGTGGARFSDVRVDDFRRGVAPIVYRFKFSTSKFVNFFHHLHSYQDESWRALGDVSTHAAKAKPMTAAPSDQEWRDYDALAGTVLQSAARQELSQMEVTRLDDNGQARGFLVRSPEPIDWKRATIKLSRATGVLSRPSAPDDVKLTAAAIGTVHPNEESATLLLREATDLTGCTVERRVLPAALAEPEGNAVFFADDFERGARGLDAPTILWQPTFTSLDEVVTVDEGADGGASMWSANAGTLKQTASITGGRAHRRTGLYPGTYTVGGDAGWEDVLISARLRSDALAAGAGHAPGSIGVMFRYQDARNYYRFAMDRLRKFRRLVRVVNGAVKTLWRDAGQYTVGATYELTIHAIGSELRGYLDGALLFTVSDRSLIAGRVALYCEMNPGACFERVVVADRSRRVDRWAVRDDGIASAPSEWRLAGGALVQGAAIGGGTTSASPGTMALADDRGWTDYRLRVRLRSDDTNAVGVVFRYVDANNYYRLSLDAQLKQRRLVRCVDGVIRRPLWREPNGFPIGETMELTIEAVGSRLVGYLGSTKLFDVTDASHPAGRIGVYTWNNPGAQFERVEVCRPPLAAYALLRDGFLAGSQTGWTVVDEGSTGGPSSFSISDGSLRQESAIHTGPIDRSTLDKLGTYALAGDPTWGDVIFTARLGSPTGSTIGIMFGYEDADNYYRFSMDRLLGYRRLVHKQEGVFYLLWEDSVLYDIARTYELTILAEGTTVRGFIDGVPAFAVQSSPCKGRIGLYAWRNSDARFSHVIVWPARVAFRGWGMDERFLSFPPPPWAVVDDGTQGGPSNWVLTDGLLQFGGIQDGSTLATPADKPGTHVVSDREWDDFRLTARLFSGDPDAIGVMFRYRDNDNYYRFSMDSALGYRRLITKVAGKVTVLWQDAGPYETNHEYIVTVDCVGDVLRGYLDGVPLFAVADAGHASGRVGAYTWKNSSAAFREFRVAPPYWAEYYSFGGEVRVPAGTRVRVHAGSAAHSAPEEWGVQRRFAASLEDPGRLTLGSGTELRVRAPGAHRGHARAFLSDSDYKPVTTTVLRKADGTGFALFPETTAGTFDAGEYRLHLEFRRNNQATDSSSTILRQAGRDTPEVVDLDVPWLTR
jgi:hypothetical protein